MYDARSIANWFVRRAAQNGARLSIMQLLKLTYIAHGWHLEVFRKPLISNRIEAWQYGPVIPDVYNNFRSQGVHVGMPLPAFDAELSADKQSFLEEIYSIYGNMSPFHLSELTHVAGGPWDTSWRIGGRYAPIPDDVILAHYDRKRAESKTVNG